MQQGICLPGSAKILNTGGRTLVWTHENTARTGINGQRCSCGCCSRTQVKAAWMTCKQLMNCQKKKKKAHKKKIYTPQRKQQTHSKSSLNDLQTVNELSKKKKKRAKTTQTKICTPLPPNKTKTPQNNNHTNQQQTPQNPAVVHYARGYTLMALQQEKDWLGWGEGEGGGGLGGQYLLKQLKRHTSVAPQSKCLGRIKCSSRK